MLMDPISPIYLNERLRTYKRVEKEWRSILKEKKGKV